MVSAGILGRQGTRDSIGAVAEVIEDEIGSIVGRAGCREDFRHIQLTWDQRLHGLLTFRRPCRPGVGIDQGNSGLKAGKVAGRQAPVSVTQPSFLCLISRKTLEASAICRYDLTELQAVFAGPYMEYQDGARRWGRYEGRVPDPRPGSVSTQAWGQY